jgi:hypothetical protein
MPEAGIDIAPDGTLSVTVVATPGEVDAIVKRHLAQTEQAEAEVAAETPDPHPEPQRPPDGEPEVDPTREYDLAPASPEEPAGAGDEAATAEPASPETTTAPEGAAVTTEPE